MSQSKHCTAYVLHMPQCTELCLNWKFAKNLIKLHKKKIEQAKRKCKQIEKKKKNSKSVYNYICNQIDNRVYELNYDEIGQETHIFFESIILIFKFFATFEWRIWKWFSIFVWNQSHKSCQLCGVWFSFHAPT